MFLDRHATILTNIKPCSESGLRFQQVAPRNHDQSRLTPQCLPDPGCVPWFFGRTVYTLAFGRVELSYTGGVRHALSEYEHNMQNESTPRALCAAVAVVLLWSLVACHDLFTWFLEVLPVIGVPLLIHLYSRYRFTNLVYSLIAVHAAILMVGGHYTYALMPVFEWIKKSFHLDRNYYDRLGHFAQGFVPAFIAREALLRWTRLERRKLLTYLVFSCCMAISALYELFEFAAAKATETAADAFLGSGRRLGHPMGHDLVPHRRRLHAAFFARIHDRALSKLKS